MNNRRGAASCAQFLSIADALKTLYVKPFVCYTALFLAIFFLSAAAFALFDVLSHDNVFANPELKVAAGWLTTGLMLLALALRGRRRRAASKLPQVERPVTELHSKN